MSQIIQHPPIQLLALDMDGTVLREDKTIAPRVQKALADAVAQGVEVVPATGRNAMGIPAEFLKAAQSRYAITANGARLVDLQTGACLGQWLIPCALALQAFDLLQKYDCVLDLFHNGTAYTTAHNLLLNEEILPENLRTYARNNRTVVPDLRAYVATQLDGIEKWSMYFRHDAERSMAWEEMQALGLEVVSSMPRNMELNAPGVEKGRCLAALCAQLGIPLAQCMACGDGGNDMGMIEQAGLGVAMQNAQSSLKAVAQYVTDSNEDDGVAHAIERFILKK